MSSPRTPSRPWPERLRPDSAPTGGHQIYWDVEWRALNGQIEAGETPVYKLSLWDTGDGMTGDEMVEYINQLSSSVGVQELDRNFGVGAKITAGVSNPVGLVYTSYKNGDVHQIHFWRDPDNDEYGIRPFLRVKDNTFQHWRKLKKSVLPKEIIDAGHGTMVTLLGSASDENTMMPPESAVGGLRWLVRYLNRRFLRFPEDVTVRVRVVHAIGPDDVAHGGYEVRPRRGNRAHGSRPGTPPRSQCGRSGRGATRGRERHRVLVVAQRGQDCRPFVLAQQRPRRRRVP